MTMHEILISNGFTHKGECKVCGGRAMEYWRVANGRIWTAKVRILGRTPEQRANNTWVEDNRGTMTGPRGLIRFFQANLLNVLQHNGLVQQEVGS